MVTKHTSNMMKNCVFKAFTSYKSNILSICTSIFLFCLTQFFVSCTTSPRYVRTLEKETPQVKASKPPVKKVAVSKPPVSEPKPLPIEKQEEPVQEKVEEKPSYIEPIPLPSTVELEKLEFVGEGLASYYHSKFQGRKTANGERFDVNDRTAAHRTLPFNTIVKVTNLTNDKFVFVRINDRGPHKHARIIDISPAAAREIDLIRSGTAKVKVELVK